MQRKCAVNPVQYTHILEITSGSCILRTWSNVSLFAMCGQSGKLMDYAQHQAFTPHKIQLVKQLS